VTIMVDGKPVTKEVTIKGIKPYVEPRKGVNETIKDWNKRRVQAMSDASKAKAELIVEAINKEFEKEFEKRGDKAKLDEPKKTPLRAYSNEVLEPSVVSLPFVKPPDPKNVGKDKQPFYRREEHPILLVKDPLGEGGDGGTFVPRSPGGLGFQGFFGPADPNVSSVATGFDSYGMPSVVRFGLEDTYVAEVTPTPGMTYDEILRALESLLDDHQIPASYDSILGELSLDSPIANGRWLSWGNTDATLEFFTGIGGVESDPVPEPATLGMLGVGLLTASAVRR